MAGEELCWQWSSQFPGKGDALGYISAKTSLIGHGFEMLWEEGKKNGNQQFV